MKKIILSTLALLAITIVFQNFSSIRMGKQREGSEPGHTGSPGDGFVSCVKCHGGSHVTVDGWITSTIPASGYVPGEIYTIRAVNTTIGHTRFGFQVSPQNISGTLLGRIIVTDTVRTKLVGDGKYITYRAASVVGVDSMVWTFDWVAPADSVNEVVFYGAFNSNHDGHKGGDVTQLSQLKVFKQGFTGIAKNNLMQLQVYPNPANAFINISFNNTANQMVSVELYNLNGQLISELHNNTLFAGLQELALPLKKVTKGIYLLKLTAGNATEMQKIVVQ
jgi:hypothetical protein